MRNYVVFFAGGQGSRISSHLSSLPKGLRLIDNRPLIWHVLTAIKSKYPMTFVICTGYLEKEYFDYFNKNFELIEPTVNHDSKLIRAYKSNGNEIILLPTGEYTPTGIRLKMASDFLNKNNVIYTYGDTIMDIDIDRLNTYHSRSNNFITISCCEYAFDYGLLEVKKEKVKNFHEKKLPQNLKINAGFIVMSNKAINQLTKKLKNIDSKFFKKFINKNKVGYFMHTGCWYPVDYEYQQQILDEKFKQNKPNWYKHDYY